MATYEFTRSDGTTFKGKGNTPEDAYAAGLAQARSMSGGEHTFASDFAAGFRQGLADPVDGAMELAEHVVGRTLTPARLQQWRERANEAGWTGTAGRVLGNVVNPLNLIPAAGVARVAGAGARILGAGARAASALGTAAGGATAALEQPVGTSDDYTLSKLGQAALGGAAGGTLGAIAARNAAAAGHSAGGHMAGHMIGHALGMPWWLRFPFAAAVGRHASGAGPAAGRAAAAVPSGSVGGVVGELTGGDDNAR